MGRIILLHTVTDDYLGDMAEQMRKVAHNWTFDGKKTESNTRYLQKCMRLDFQTGTRMVYVRENNHHKSGWFANPDLERTKHLSLSFFSVDEGPRMDRDFDEKLAERWVRAFYDTDMKWLWGEPPVTRKARRSHVQHYRLFCDTKWKAFNSDRIKYRVEFTAKKWKSASELFERSGLIITSTLTP